jgi:hypothetical protein
MLGHIENRKNIYPWEAVLEKSREKKVKNARENETELIRSKSTESKPHKTKKEPKFIPIDDREETEEEEEMLIRNKKKPKVTKNSVTVETDTGIQEIHRDHPSSIDFEYEEPKGNREDRLTIKTYDPEEIRILLTYHARNDQVEFNQGSKCFYIKKSKVDYKSGSVKEAKFKARGLVPFLTSVFWPDYEYSPNPMGGKTGVSSAFEGKQRGDLVHKQIQHFQTLKGEKEISSFVQDPNTHDYTKKAIAALLMYKWKIVASEFMCFDEDLNVATKIDAIVVDEKGRLCVLDWKCGGDHYFERGNGFLSGPFPERKNNSPKNQALLQAFFGQIILEKHYSVVIHKSYAINITMTHVNRIPCYKEWYNMKEQLYRYAIESKQRNS